MLSLVVRFDLPDAQAAAAFDEVVAEVVPVIREREPGTLLYLTHEVHGEPLARVFFEQYADRAALEEHEAQPHTAAFLARVRGLVVATRVEHLAELPGT